jgi:PIN domain nuclease of toxin-antitoxin system
MGGVRLLLDTHVLLWAVLEPGKLPPGLLQLLEDPACRLLVSAASAWEIATKWRIGKLPGAAQVVSNYGRALDGLGASELPISSKDALQAGLWTVEHRDPFDRLLAAQARLLDLELASTDAVFARFEGVRVRCA